MWQRIDDNLMVERVVKGDEAAFMSLYDRHASHVYALTLQILHDPMLAEEATQDTFLKLWGRARQYLAGRGSLSDLAADDRTPHCVGSGPHGNPAACTVRFSGS